MRRKKIIEAAVVCILLLLLGAYMEFSDRSMDDKNRIIRGSPGSGRQEVELTLNAGEKLKNYDYQVSVPAQPWADGPHHGSPHRFCGSRPAPRAPAGTPHRRMR